MGNLIADLESPKSGLSNKSTLVFVALPNHLTVSPPPLPTSTLDQTMAINRC